MTSTIQFDAELHEYRVNGVVKPHITGILAGAGICDFSCVPEETRIHSMGRGTSVHWLLQLEDEQSLNYRRVPAPLRGYRTAWNTWKRHSLFNPILIEHMFYSHLGYTGRLDRTGSFPATSMYLSGTVAVVEIKTGEVPDWARIQLAAQAAGIEPNLSLARLIRRIGVSVRADGTYSVKEFPLCTWDRDIAKFMEALKKCQKSSSKK